MQPTTQITSSPFANHKRFAYRMESYAIEDEKIIVVVHSGNLSRDADDTVIEMVVNAVNTYPDPNVAYVLVDITLMSGVTPHLRQGALGMTNNFDPNRQIYIAVFGSSNSIMNMLVHRIINQMVRFVDKRVHITLLNKRDDAIKWLLQKSKINQV